MRLRREIGDRSGVLSHDQSGVVSWIYLFSFSRTQNELEPFGNLIRVPMTCYDLNFQGDRPKGASRGKKYVSDDLFFCGAPHLFHLAGNSKRFVFLIILFSW